MIKNIAIFFILFFLYSCDKVIDIDIKDVEKKYVIEAVITDTVNSCRVNLTQTFNMNDSNKFVGVEGANITISEDGRQPIKLTPLGDGLYRTNLRGRPGHTYTLHVEVGGQEFTATSTMPVTKVIYDSLYATERIFLGKTRKIATVNFTDPPGLGNIYRFVQYVNGVKENTIFILEDKFIDGRKVVHELLVFDETYDLGTPDPDEPPNTVMVEMHCITPSIYTYWYSLSQSALGQSQSASPGNPVSLFSNGALGYFSAHTSYTGKSIPVN